MTRLHMVAMPIALGLAFAAQTAVAQQVPTKHDQQKEAQAEQSAKNLPSVVVEATEHNWRQYVAAKLKHQMSEVAGTKITVTRKSTVTHLNAQPTIVNQNLQQLFERSPGLLVSQQQTPTQINLSYRGLGNPQESEYVLVMQDGIPLESDWIGFPTLYAVPLPQSIADIQLIRGGSSLLYGPEPEPAVNLISKRPKPGAPFSVSTNQVFGNHGLYSTYNAIEGSAGKWTWRVDAGYVHSNGPRDNVQSRNRQADVYAEYRTGKDDYAWLFVHAIGLDSGDPGRMSYAQWTVNPKATPSPWNHIWLDRYQVVVGKQSTFGNDWLFVGKAWVTYLDKASRGANGALPPAPPPASTTLQDEQFRTQGVDMRVRKKWGRGNAFTAGLVAFHGDDPFRQWDSPNLYVDRYDRTGTPRLRQQRQSNYFSIFAENVFRLPGIHIVPSVRIEKERVAVTETVKPPFLSRALINQSDTRTVPLLGIGIGNDFGSGNETYLNVSQGWRPLRYFDMASPFANVTGPAPDPQKVLSWEAGVHGVPLAGLYYDASVFWVNFRDRIETEHINATDVIEINAGDSRHRGFEGEIDYDFFAPTMMATRGQHLEGFFSVSLLDAEFTHSSIPGQVGRPVPYAPRYLMKGGVIWRVDKKAKVSLTVISSASQYWRDAAFGNGAHASVPSKIPACTRADFAADWQLTPHVKLLGGISNLTDRKYYNRVFITGLVPAPGRTWYAGVELKM